MYAVPVPRQMRRLTTACSAVALPCTARPVAGQIVNGEVPCNAILSEVASLELLEKTVISNPTNLSGALYQMEACKGDGLLSLGKRGDGIAAGKLGRR